MPIHQLVAGEGVPREVLLAELATSGTPTFDLIFQLGAFHAGRTGRPEFRTRLAAAGTPRRYFPDPCDVPPLMLIATERLAALFATSSGPLDDLRAAAAVIWAVTAIHPFDGGNGRTAIDLAELCLMHRWQISTPPLCLPKNAHDVFAEAWIREGWFAPDPSQEALARLRERLVDSLMRLTHASLRARRSINAVTIGIGRHARFLEDS
jgi:hypothetical protein